MEPKVIEGIWAEVARRGPELAGHRVRVTVLDDLTLPAAHADELEAETAFDVLSRAGLIGCLNGGPVDLATNLAHMEGFGAQEQRSTGPESRVPK